MKKLEIKKIRQDRRAAKANGKAAKYMGKGDFKTASAYFKKSSKKQRHAQKRAKTIWHNKKLWDMYAKRIKTLDPEGCKVGKEFLDEVMSNYGNRRTILY